MVPSRKCVFVRGEARQTIVDLNLLRDCYFKGGLPPSAPWNAIDIDGRLTVNMMCEWREGELHNEDE